jgi:hypothetical protein
VAAPDAAGPDPGTHWDLEVLAAGLRRDAEDLSLYAGFLLGALPAELVRVEHAGGLLRRLRGGERPVVAVSVLLGNQRFTLRRDAVGAPPRATVAHESGGVVLGTDETDLREWSQRLATALAGYARQHAGAAAALARLTLPGAP